MTSLSTNLATVSLSIFCSGERSKSISYLLHGPLTGEEAAGTEI